MEDKLVGGSSESLDGPPYSLPGVLQFVQHEWARFERERSRWEIERAELQVRGLFYLLLHLEITSTSHQITCPPLFSFCQIGTCGLDE